MPKFKVSEGLSSRLRKLPVELQQHTIQVEEDLYLASLYPDEPPDYINHSCNPNTGLNGQITLVAMRDIAPGEEVTFDYAMADGTPYDQFVCHCGAANCRGRVAGDDWRNPELWERYAGYFAPYLQRRIERLKRLPAQPRPPARPRGNGRSRTRADRVTNPLG